MPNPIVELVKEEMIWFTEIQAEYADLFPPNNLAPSLYPIPFFGDIRSADVLTVALNPAWKEFERSRGWLSNLDASALTTRILHYFDLPEPSPHPFFKRLLPACAQLGRSYRRGVAHVDILSCPTQFPGGMGDAQRQQLNVLVDSAAARLQRVLNFCCAAKIIFLLDYTVHNGNGAQWTVWEKAVQHVPIFTNHAASGGLELPILRVNGPEQLANEIANRRDETREYLANGPRVLHANYG